MTTCSVTYRSPRPRRLTFGTPLPLSRITVPDSVPGSIRRCSDAVERLDLDVGARASPASSRRRGPRTGPGRAGRTPATARPDADVQVTGRTARDAGVPGAAHAQLHPVGDAGRDVHRHRRATRARGPRRSTSRTCRGSPGRCRRTSCTATPSSRCRRCCVAPAGPRPVPPQVRHATGAVPGCGAVAQARVARRPCARARGRAARRTPPR